MIRLGVLLVVGSCLREGTRGIEWMMECGDGFLTEGDFEAIVLVGLEIF